MHDHGRAKRDLSLPSKPNYLVGLCFPSQSKDSSAGLEAKEPSDQILVDINLGSARNGAAIEEIRNRDTRPSLNTSRDREEWVARRVQAKLLSC
jgi:hypothetical protein